MDSNIYHVFRNRHGGGCKAIATEGEELECAKGVLGPRKENGGAVDVRERLDRGRGGAGGVKFARGKREGDNIDVLRGLFWLS